jgi:hypothetical protein
MQVTTDTSDAVPFLQIVHVSDLHIVDPGFPHRDELLEIDRIARPFPPLRDMWIDGTAPHDPLAPAEFEEFLRLLTVDDPEWSCQKTWLVDTGDLTTFGDDGSLILGRNLLQRWASMANAELLMLHGNHDAWPLRLPLRARTAALQAHRAGLRRNHYPQRWPEPPLRRPIPNTNADVVMFGLNSVLHERWRNTLARGEVKEDRYWEQRPAPQPDVQIDRLSQQVGAGQSFRIVAVHHPVHYPKRPPLGMHMDNDSAVARALGGPSRVGVAPLAHLVLSGHTHKLFPKHGELPSDVRKKLPQPDLGMDQFQLIVGSLMQHDLLGDRGAWPHQCQILRFYAPRRHRNVLVIERLFGGRTGGTGPYRLVLTDSGDDAQEIVATY